MGYWSIRSSSELKSIEKRSSVREVWLYTSNLSNDVGRDSEFSKVVRENAKRGTKYKLIIPEGKITKQALQSFCNLFPVARGKRSGITQIVLTESEFFELIPGQQITSTAEAPHVVIYNPGLNSQTAEVYIEDSKSRFSFLWRKMEGDEAKTILKRFTELVKRRS